MADRGILIDTSVIIDFLRKKNKQNSILWKLKENHDCFMSAITLFELFAGATDDQKIEDVRKVAKWIEPILFDGSSETESKGLIPALLKQASLEVGSNKFLIQISPVKVIRGKDPEERFSAMAVIPLKLISWMNLR